MTTGADKTRERIAELGTELRETRASNYLEPWNDLTPDQRWERAMVWEGTDGAVLIGGQVAHDSRSFQLRGAIVGPAHQSFASHHGDVLIVNVAERGIGYRTQLHVVPLRDIVRISELADDDVNGVDHDFEIEN